MKMNPQCSECKFVFEREPGYFLGAMSLSYAMGFVAILPPFLFLLLKGYSFPLVIGIPSVELILLSPFAFRFSRLIWISIDNRTDH